MKLVRKISFVIVFTLIMTIFMPVVNAATISMSRTTISRIMDQKYTGKDIKPDVVIRYNGRILEKGEDYTLSYSNNKNAGTAKVTIKGKGDFTGTKTTTFRIIKTGYYYDYDYDYDDTISITRATVSSVSNKYYTGKYIEPTVKVKYDGETLEEGEDYTLSYSNNKNVGTATIKITGEGRFYGTKKVTFKILSNSVSISRATISSIPNQYYTGSYIKPDVTVKYDGDILEEGEDYTLSYSNNKNVGTAKVTIKGKGDFTGTTTKTFKIVSRSVSITRADISNILNQEYTGSYIKPNVTVRYNGELLEKNVDYTVSYSNNKNIGTAKVTIKGKGNYTGTITKTFKIIESDDYYYDDDYEYSDRISITKADISNILNQKYTGSYIKPSVTVRYKSELLRKNVDYTVSYSNNKNIGTAKVTIKGKGDFKGTVTKTFKIVSSSGYYDDDYYYNDDYNYGYKISMSEVTVSNILNQMFSGAYVKPNVTVRYNGKKLTKGTDYTLSYSNNVNPGIATVTITGKGDYTGSITKTFRIVVK